MGHSDEYPDDGGFGIKGWRSIDSETAANFIQGDVAMWMGRVMCTDKNGDVTKVDKSWGYKKDKQVHYVLCCTTLRCLIKQSELRHLS